MNYRNLSLGLGAFSLALGAAELFGARRLTRALDAEGREKLVRGFGAREVAAGIGILAAPDKSAGVWSRVAGDTLDLGALGVAAAKSPRNATIWASLAFVVGATILDIVVARGLDRTASEPAPA